MFCRSNAAALLLGAVLLAARGAAAAALETPQPAPRAIAYAMWNDEHLFLGARVDDIALTGTNDTALSEAWRDDSVEFYLDLSGVPADRVHPNCVRVVVSAAGGFTCLVGTSAATWKPQAEWLRGLKLSVEREGTLNRSADTDIGYIVELGIPWRFLGGTPAPGRRIGFNFTVNVRGENETFVSWASRAQTREDLDRPRLWGAMVLSPGTMASVAQDDVLVCPRTYTPPLVDGRLGAAEWLGASVVQLQKPAPELVRQPAAGRPGARVLATYRYDYQVLPASRASNPAALSLADYPAEGVGPWFSADSVAWHKAMLRQARQAAIDVILPIYRGDPAARRDWSRLGLLRLVQALKETKDERLTYPLVAMYLDASCLPLADAADLSSQPGRRALWGMVQEFFSIIPDEFRAQFDIGAAERSNLLVLGPPLGVEKWDAALFDLLRANFKRDFGARLVILADEAWRANAPNLDGYCSLEPAIGLSYGKQGPRSVARLSPGHVEDGLLLPRQGGQAFEHNWIRALAVLPEFVIIDSLNDFARGSEIAHSRQHGVRFLDITRQSVQALVGRYQYRIALRRETLPPALHPGATYQVELLVENQGFEDLSDRQNVEISYTLQHKQRPDLRRTGVATPKLLVLAGQRAPLLVEISTRRVEGPLPVGDYELTFEVTKSTLPILRSRWFARELFQVSLPVRIDRVHANRFTVLGTTLPSALGSGARRRVRVRLRNDGSAVWKARQCALSYHWVRGPGAASPAAAPEVIEWEGVRTPLPKDVRPGEMVTVNAWVEARRADGTPLPPWSPEDDWLYQLEWDLVEGADRWFSRQGASVYPESVAVLASDFGPTVVNAEMPPEMEAGKTYPVRVVVRNGGTSPWNPDNCAVSYHWHYWDGAQASPHGVVTPLAAAIAPGEAAMLTAQVTAPDYPGSYYLAWDLVFGGRYASEMLDAGSTSLLVQPVKVRGGGLLPLDLSQHFNTLASTQDRYRGRGAFDPAGLSFPAEFVPPDSAAAGAPPGVEEPAYPGVYFAGASSSESLARVPLRYPPMDQRGGGAIACAGQAIPLPQEPLRAIYIAASASSAAEVEFRVTYPDGDNQAVSVRIPSWVEPSPDAAVAVRAPYLRGAQEDLPRPCYIYLLRIGDLARSDPPTALILPAAPQVKVFAITVERAPTTSAGGS